FILECATPPNIYLDPAICRGPSSAWCQMLRQLKSFILVCRVWRDVGTNILYRCVVIRRFGQIPALLRTLQGDPKLGPMIHELQIRCFVPRGYSTVFEQALAQLWPLCPSTTRLSLDHPMDDPHHEFPSVMDSILPSIVDLEIGPDCCFQRALPSLLQCTGLVALSVHFLESMDGADDVPFVLLASLEELHVTWNDRPFQSQNTIISAIISDRCIMPRLKRLTLVLLTQFPQPPMLASASTFYNPLIRAHGERLTYLSICFLSISYSNPIVPANKEIQSYLDLCPSLQHFSTGGHTGALGLSHPKLEYLDVWIDSLPSGRCELSNWQEHLPALRKIRFLDLALMGTTGPRLPLVVPPD
ncbi:hypothetical protein F5I97DRAFT_1795848, partial [Phlebopus sp. FC_14]